MTKLIFIFVFIFSIMTTFLIIMDLLLGIPFKLSLNNVLNPFWVMEAGELSILFLLVAVSFAIPLTYYYKVFLKKNT